MCIFICICIFEAVKFKNSSLVLVIMGVVQVLLIGVVPCIMDRAGWRLLLTLLGVIMVFSKRTCGAYFRLTQGVSAAASL
jgi:hypothetical protein